MSEFKNLPSGWNVVRLGEISSRVTRRNQDNRCQNVLTISAQSGLINQTDFFNKQVASKDLSNYILLKKGEFAYNKSYSTGYSFGAFKRLKFYEEGVASPLYIYFKFNDDVCSDFFEFYFDAGQANRQIKDIVQEGARNHGLLNLSIDDFFNIKIRMPNLDEQKKIAEILSTWDEAINLTINLIESKKQFKKALMQNLLTAKIRFPQFKGEWKFTKLGNLLDYEQPTQYLVSDENYDNGFGTPVLTAGKTFILGYTNETKGIFQDNLPVIIFDDFTTATQFVNFPFKVKSSAMKILKQKNTMVNIRLVYEMMQMINFVASDHKRYWISEFQDLEIKLPNLNEQQKIAEVLTACDDEINLLNLKLENLKKQKQCLMQKLLKGEIRTCYVKKAM